MSNNSFLMRHKISCRWSGVQIGELEVKTVAGALPYLSHWNECVAYHPLFSLAPGRLLPFMHKEWQRLHSKVEAEEITPAEEEILCVGFLAMLHSLDSLKQDIPACPPLQVVQDNISPLFALAFWKWKLESLRFRFPVFHISKYNNNANFSNLGHYLTACFDIKKDYETNVRETEERAKVVAAERALVALNNSWIVAPSPRVLWKWVAAHLATSPHKDDQFWIGELFLAGPGKIVNYDRDELDLMEEMILASCPAGTGLLKAVRERIDWVKHKWAEHHRAFDIVLTDFSPVARTFVNGVEQEVPDPGPAPQRTDFSSPAAFYVAQAKWSLLRAAFEQSKKSPGDSATPF